MPYKRSQARALLGRAGRAGPHWDREPGRERVLPRAPRAAGARGGNLPLHRHKAEATQPQHIHSSRSSSPSHLWRNPSSWFCMPSSLAKFSVSTPDTNQVATESLGLRRVCCCSA